MKGNYQTLEQFAAEVERREKTKVDLVAPAKSILMVDDRFLAIENDATYGINDFAHGQLAARLDVPKRYYDDIAGKVPGLRSTIVNETIRAYGKRHLLRTLDGTTRAVLSDRYRTLDNYETLRESIFPAVMEFKDSLRVVSQGLSDTRMYLQFVIPSMEASIVPGDVVQYGITVSNSEVGAGALDIKSLVWRLKCLNGVVGESLFRKYHVGKRIESGDDENYGIYTDETIVAELKATKLRMRDVIAAALKDDVFGLIVERMRDARNDEIRNVTETVERVQRRFPGLLYESDRDRMAENIFREGEVNRYGLMNSITALAHQIENQDRAYEIERLGSTIINLSKKEWSVLSEAA